MEIVGIITIMIMVAGIFMLGYQSKDYESGWECKDEDE